MGDIAQVAYLVSIWALPVVFAITVHEAGHAYVAYWLGDDFSHRNGRTSLNPLVHIDLVGTLLLPAILLVTSAGFIIGYAKPVPVFFKRLRPERIGTALVAFAGPLANIILALLAAVCLHFVPLFPNPVGLWLEMNLNNAVVVNALLAAFNMLPIPPLDGGRILMVMMPPWVAQRFEALERFGILFVFGLALILPALLSEFGVRFNPVADWAVGGARFILSGVYGITS